MLPSTDLLSTPSELWVMFNSPAVTAVDPHGNWIFFFFVRITLVQVKRGGHWLRRFGEVTLSHIVQRPLHLSLTSQVQLVCFWGLMVEQSGTDPSDLILFIVSMQSPFWPEQTSGHACLHVAEECTILSLTSFHHLFVFTWFRILSLYIWQCEGCTNKDYVKRVKEQ